MHRAFVLRGRVVGTGEVCDAPGVGLGVLASETLDRAHEAIVVEHWETGGAEDDTGE